MAHRAGAALDAEIAQATALGIPIGAVRQAQFFGDIGVLIQSKQAEISLAKQQTAFQITLNEQLAQFREGFQTIQAPIPTEQPIMKTESICPIFGNTESGI